MEGSRRDATDEWVLPERSRPPLLGELEARIDHALATARSSEAAAIAVGATALDAAEQARRSAELAERAHALVAEKLASEPKPAGPQPVARPAPPSQPVVPDPPSSPGTSASPRSVPQPPPSSNGPGTKVGPHEEDPLHAFIARADRISARLQRLQAAPLTAAR
jgi:hypothetical protein